MKATAEEQRKLFKIYKRELHLNWTDAYTKKFIGCLCRNTVIRLTRALSQ